MTKPVRPAHETWKHLNQESNFQQFMKGLLAYLQKNLQIIKVYDGKSSYQYYSCGQPHDPRNSEWRPFQIIETFCRKKRCDFEVVKSMIEERLFKKLICECEILTNTDDLRRKDLERSFGLDFGAPGRKELDIV